MYDIILVVLVPLTLTGKYALKFPTLVIKYRAIIIKTMVLQDFVAFFSPN